TPLLKEFAQELRLHDVGWCGIDAAALVYNDHEIERRPVAAFMKTLNRTARDLDAGFLLAAHTSRSSKGTTATMVSGSTAWVAQARAGLLLEADDDGEATLSLIKPTSPRRGISIDLKFNDDGVLVLRDKGGMVDSIERSKDDRLVLSIIDQRWKGDAEPLSKIGDTSVTKYLKDSLGWKAKRA